MRKLTTNSVTQSQSTRARIEHCVAPKTFWRHSTAAAVLTLMLGFGAQDASALALGRVTVLSALGEPLRAEIDVPEITAEEASSLRTSIASPDAFRTAGLEYNSALGGAQIMLQRRPNGTAFLRVSSDRVINDPFVDLILDVSWASGRIVRDYTMLFDPANLRQAAAPSITAPIMPAAPAAPPIVSRAAPTSPAVAPRVANTQDVPKAAAKRPIKNTPATPKSSSSSSLTIKAGDTAAALAAQYKPQGVSLDQMLVAMLNTSPEAFVGNNVNRLKSGAVIDIQAAVAAAPATGAGDAKQTISVQAKDFNEFRRRLASGAPTAVATAPTRAASGKVQANVSEPKAGASTPDKLTLSKGSVAAKAKEESIAKDKQAKDNAARVAELSKNMADLNKLGTATAAKPSATPTPAAAPAASTSGIQVAGSMPAASATATIAKAITPASSAPASSAPASSAPAALSATVAASTATTPTLSASTATASTASTATSSTSTPTVAAATAAASSPTPVKPKASLPPPPPPPEPSFIESLTDNPAVLPGAGALLVGLGGLAFWRMRQRKKAAQVDSSFLESRLQPDSFFGASGGQRVDTADSGSAAGAGSSMVYSPSQLDAAGDVDPVAEADVYLAYGRDLQAEEILKEAMRTSPSRVAIHIKLMEIYAKRRDAKAFENVAKEAFKLTQGASPDWEAASALGRELDPANPLYQQGNAPSASGLAGSVMMGGAAAVAAAAAASSSAYNATQTVPSQAQAQTDSDFDIDFDLDFSAASDALASPPNPDNMIGDASVEATAAYLPATAELDPMVDFDMSEPAALGAVKISAPDFESFSSNLDFASAPVIPSAATLPMSLKTGPSSTGALEFDLGGLSLDLPSLSGSVNNVDASVSGDPLETKLALALEFRDIGDSDGARSLVQEVADEASGPLKARALKMLADLG